jgi:hypothetical protein
MLQHASSVLDVCRCEYAREWLHKHRHLFGTIKPGAVTLETQQSSSRAAAVLLVTRGARHLILRCQRRKQV